MHQQALKVKPDHTRFKNYGTTWFPNPPSMLAKTKTQLSCWATSTFWRLVWHPLLQRKESGVRSGQVVSPPGQQIRWYPKDFQSFPGASWNAISGCLAEVITLHAQWLTQSVGKQHQRHCFQEWWLRMYSRRYPGKQHSCQDRCYLTNTIGKEVSFGHAILSTPCELPRDFPTVPL